MFKLAMLSMIALPAPRVNRSQKSVFDSFAPAVGITDGLQEKARVIGHDGRDHVHQLRETRDTHARR